MLEKLRVVLILVLLLASITAAASVAPAFQDAAPWRTFTSAEGKFSLLMPAETKTEVQDVDSEVGKLTMYSYTASSKDAFLMASYGDYPREPVDADHVEQVLTGVHDGVLKSIGGQELSNSKIVLKGRAKSGALVEYPGRDFTGTKMNQGSEIFFSWRIYLVGRRLYQLAIITNKADANSPDVSKFLTSFQLTN